MTHTNPDHTSLILEDVLQHGADALLAAGRPVDRVARFPGVPSWDCEMLVAFPRTRIIGIGPTSSTARSPVPDRYEIRHILEINVTLLRCITALTPTGMPSAAIVDADGDGYAIDMWVLQLAYTSGIIDGSLFGGCPLANMQPFTPLTPSGSLSAFSTTIEVTL